MPAGLLSRALVTMVGLGVQGLGRFLYTLVIGRILGPEPLGDVSAVLSLAVYLSLFWPAATGLAASRYLALSTGRTVILELKLSFVTSATILTVLAFPLALWLTGDVATAALSCVLVLSYSGYVFVRGAMLGQDRYVRATVFDAVSSMTTLTALALVLLGGAEAVILVPLALGYLLFTALGWPRSRNSSRATPDERQVLNRYLRHTTLAALATGGLLPATMIFVRLFDSAVGAGIFAAGLSLATPASLLSQALNQVLVPFFARRFESNPATLARIHVRILVLSVLVFTTIFLVLIVLAPALLRVLYGEQFVAGAAHMQALLLVVLLISCMSAPSALLVVIGRERLYAGIWVVAFFAGTLLMCLLAPPLGIQGVLMGFALGGGGGSVAVILAALTTARINDQSIGARAEK